MNRARFPLIVSLFLGILIGAFAFSGPLANTFAQSDATPATQSQTQSDYPGVNVVKTVGSAVVTVINEQTAAAPGTNSSSLQPVGSGTGFIIDDQGHIVTNWHVVEGGQKFQVVFADGSVMMNAGRLRSDQRSGGRPGRW